jgi:hypothetical protein
MARALRPGGRLVLADDDHEILRLWPEPPGLLPIWQGYIRSYDRLGNDPYIGRRLVELLQQAGTVPIRNDWLFFGACAGNSVFPDIALNLERILIGARALIVSTARITELSFERAISALKAWSVRPDAALWFAMCWAEGLRPESNPPTREAQS